MLRLGVGIIKGCGRCDSCSADVPDCIRTFRSGKAPGLLRNDGSGVAAQKPDRRYEFVIFEFNMFR